MEWNERPPLLWDWENLIVLNPLVAEREDIIHRNSFENKLGINFESSNSDDDDRCTGGPFFELAKTSPKSSKSVSENSSSIEKSRTTKFTLEGFEPTLENTGNKKESVKTEVSNIYATLETSTCSCEPMLSLKLGKQAYFENSRTGNHTRPFVSMTESRAARKRGQNTPSPCCQVDGCNIDLSNCKDYYRKHRVCVSHSKSPKVVIEGIERRFCQQCSRFHGISEFDEKKRSCRRRLSNHNARRRKQHLKAIGLNPAKLSLWDFERRQIDVFSNKLSLVYSTSHGNSACESTFNLRHPEYGMYVLKPERACGSTGQLNVFGDEMHSVHAMPYHDAGRLVSFKGPATKVLDTAQDFRRALSLLSTDLSAAPYEAKLFSPNDSNRLGDPNYVNQTTASQSPMNLETKKLHFPPVDLGCWDDEQQTIESQMQIHHPDNEGNSMFQDFRPFETPCEIEMFSNHMG